jgi:transposase
MRGEVLGVERRRRWSDDDKIAIVGSVGVNGATVTQVAQRHDVTRQQIYAWRHGLKKKGFCPSEAGAVFLAIDVPTMESVAAEPTPAPVELLLTGGRCLRFDSMMEQAALTRVIRAVEAA